MHLYALEDIQYILLIYYLKILLYVPSLFVRVGCRGDVHVISVLSWH